MWHNGRRVVVARSWAFARQQFASVIAERDSLKHELEWTQQALADCRQTLHELQAAVLARTNAYHDLRHLQRERDIVRARNAVRDPSVPLQ